MLKVQEFFEDQSSTLTYLLYDSVTKDAVIVDPILNYNEQKLEEFSYQQLKVFIEKEGLTPHYSIETHIHADHISAGLRLKRDFPSIKTAISSHVTIVQEAFSSVLNLPDNFKPDGSQFDILFKDAETIDAGSIKIKVISTPGHTPTCTSLLIEDKLLRAMPSLCLTSVQVDVTFLMAMRRSSTIL